MEVGDKLICKNDSSPFVKDFCYDIYKLEDNIVWVRYTKWGDCSIGTNYGIDAFSLVTNIRLPSYSFEIGLPYYGDYFHTEKELRKLKLDKLNENR